MGSINRWVGLGRLGKDIEVKKTQSGLSVCSFQIAIDRMKQKDQDHADTDWIDCVAWRATADYLSNYAKVGDQIAVDGRLQVRTWDDTNGQKHYKTEVIIDNASICSSTKKSSSTPATGTSYKAKDIKAATPEEIARQAQAEGEDISSDDLPF
jgi:single-strand DNA-binding protein